MSARTINSIATIGELAVAYHDALEASHCALVLGEDMHVHKLAMPRTGMNLRWLADDAVAHGEALPHLVERYLEDAADMCARTLRHLDDGDAFLAERYLESAMYATKLASFMCAHAARQNGEAAA